VPSSQQKEDLESKTRQTVSKKDQKGVKRNKLAAKRIISKIGQIGKKRKDSKT